MRETDRTLSERVLCDRAVEQIRDALVILMHVDDGCHEDTAHVSLNALDWLERHIGGRTDA